MRFTTVQTNLLILALILVGLQGVILYFVNGELSQMLRDNEFDALGLVFSPTAAIVWALKNAGQNYEQQ